MSELRQFLVVDDEIRHFRARRADLVWRGLQSVGLDDDAIRGNSLVDYALANEVGVFVRDSLGRVPDGKDDLLPTAERRLKIAATALTPLGAIRALRCEGLGEDQCMFAEGVVLGSLIDEEQRLLGRAVEVLERTGTLSCFTDSVGIVAVLGVVAPGAPVATWATGGLPYVVHLHLMPRPELVARDLIHEATHTYLNDWLGSRDVRLDPVTPRFWSPWKDTNRPLFGFVHSIMAFSVVTAFLSSVAGGKSSDLSWLRPFRDAERDRLRSCAESVASAVSMLPEELGRKISAVHALATE